MNNNLISSFQNFDKKNIKIFQVQNKYNFKLSDIIIFLVFFIIVPILWAAIRAIAFPNYTKDMIVFIESGDALKHETQILYTISLIGIQIFVPIVGAFILFFKMKSAIFSSGLYIFFLLYPAKLLISLIFSSFTNSVDGLNTFIIDFLYSFAIVIFVFIKNKNIQNMFKIAYANFWKSLFYIIFFCILYFAFLYFLFFISSLLNTGNKIGNQTIIKSSLTSPFAIVAIFFSVVITAPLIEEIVYRMILADVVKNRWYSYIITTIFFAFLHIQVVGDWENIFPYFALGLVNGFIYWQFKNISIPMFVHFLANVVGFILLFATN